MLPRMDTTYAARVMDAVWPDPDWRSRQGLLIDGEGHLWNPELQRYAPLPIVATTVWLERAVLAAVDAAAQRAGRTRAEQIVQLVQRFVDAEHS
jgi:hypothetical protein